MYWIFSIISIVSFVTSIPVILHSDLLPLLDVLLGLNPDVLLIIHPEPGVPHTAVVDQGKCGENSSPTEACES